MFGSMVDIQSATAEIKQAKKKRKKKPQGKNIMSASAMQGGHNEASILQYQTSLTQTLLFHHYPGNSWLIRICLH